MRKTNKFAYIAIGVIISFIISLGLPGVANAAASTKTTENTAKLTVTKDKDGKYKDSLEYTFTLDEAAIGEWETVDYCNDINDFKPNAPIKYPDLPYIGHSIYENGTLTYHFADYYSMKDVKWTKGYIINIFPDLVPAYTIKEIDGKTYMFLEWKTGYTIDTGITEGYCVLKKTSNIPKPTPDNAISRNDPKLIVTKDKDGIIHEKLDYIFTLDKAAIGEWKTVYYCKFMDQFKPGVKTDIKFWYTGHSIYEDGTMTQHRIAADEKTETTGIKWTKGYIIDLMKGSSLDLIPAYTIKEIDGKTYMFLEWKSGYTARTGQIEGYYVFEKVSDTPRVPSTTTTTSNDTSNKK